MQLFIIKEIIQTVHPAKSPALLPEALHLRPRKFLKLSSSQVLDRHTFTNRTTVI